MDKGYDVTALICSYRPSYEKLIMTIKSFLLQKDVSVQIVVADDGSEKDYFSEIETYFHENDFNDYILVKNAENGGTVKNSLSGIRKCEGRYVKTISPGDYMGSDTALRHWIDYMEAENLLACGANYYCYYCDGDGKLAASQQNLHPRIKGLSGAKLRMNYLINDDIFLGAAILCERELLLKYVSLLEDMVKYAEDNCYRMMAYCGESMGFFDEETVLYEVGTGISTCKDDKWKKLLSKDWNVTDNMMLLMETKDKKMKKMFKDYKTAKMMRGGATLPPVS